MGWSGCDRASGATCTVTMSASRAVTATFRRPTLTLAKAGTGQGAVTSSVPGIDCGPASISCTASYDSGTALTLTASPAAGSTFSSWSGCDAANGNACSLTLNASRTVTSTFSVASYTLTVTQTAMGTRH